MDITRYRPIPTIAQGEKLSSDSLKSKNNCYYFESFEKALDMLRRGKPVTINKYDIEEIKAKEEEQRKEVARKTEVKRPIYIRREPGSRTLNLVGNTYNWLTVIAFAGITNGRTARWLCRCVCGNEKVIDGNNLKSGSTKSCGCMQKQMTSELGKSHKGNLARKKKDDLRINVIQDNDK